MAMLKKSLIAFGLRAAGAVTWLVFSLWLARVLTAQDFGIAFYAINTATLAAALVTSGYAPALLRLGAPAWATGRVGDLSRLLLRGLAFAALGTGVCAGLVWLGPQVTAGNLIYSAPALPWLLVAMVAASAAIQLLANAFRATGSLAVAVLSTSVFRVGVPLILTGVLYGMAIIGAVPAAAAFAVGTGAVALAMGGALARRMANGPRSALGAEDGSDRAETEPDAAPDTTSANRRTIWWLWVLGLARILVQNADALLIGSLLGAVEAGLYLAAKRVAAMVQMVADAVRVAAGPRLAVLFAQSAAATATPDDRAAFRRAAAEANLLFMVLVGGACIGLAALGWPMLALFGPAFTAAYPVLLVMIAGVASFAVLGPVGLLMTMTRLERPRALITIAGAVIACGGVLWLTPMTGPWGGMMGAALALLVASFVTNGASSWVIWRALAVPPAIVDAQAWAILRRSGLRGMLAALRKPRKDPGDSGDAP